MPEEYKNSKGEVEVVGEMNNFHLVNAFLKNARSPISEERERTELNTNLLKEEILKRLAPKEE